MNEKDIKKLLIEKLFDKNNNNYFVEELKIVQHKSRADLVYFTEKLSLGFEIKSNLDSLSRFDHQKKFYEQCFNQNYIVIGEKHLNKTLKRLSGSTWGIILVYPDKTYKILQKAQKNPLLIKDSSMRLLDRKFIKRILKELKGIEIPNSTKNIYRFACQHISWEELNPLLWQYHKKSKL